MLLADPDLEDWVRVRFQAKFGADAVTVQGAERWALEVTIDELAGPGWNVHDG